MNNPKKTVVVKLSGSIFNYNADIDRLKKISSMLIDIFDSVQPIIIAGGGDIARHYIKIARKFGSDESSLDLIGIDVSRLNAKLLSTSLGIYAHDHIPRTLDEISPAKNSGKIIITGGLHPGQSTNATAALIAEKTRAELFINATDVNGIYDSDPNQNKEAKLFQKISVSDCLNLLIKGSSSAGTYDLMDIVSLKIIERSKIKTFVILSDPTNIKNTILNNQTNGTEIIF
ncbi:MAG: UMP kinase [Nitrososphaeraceae archaeon]|nr:UMP kinase [Nitrososphaeraceae archaeon]